MLDECLARFFGYLLRVFRRQKGACEYSPLFCWCCCVLMYICIALAQSLLECVLRSYTEIDVEKIAPHQKAYFQKTKQSHVSFIHPASQPAIMIALIHVSFISFIWKPTSYETHSKTKSRRLDKSGYLLTRQPNHRHKSSMNSKQRYGVWWRIWFPRPCPI